MRGGDYREHMLIRKIKEIKFIDSYDKKYGEPTTEVFSSGDFIDYLDNIISDIDRYLNLYESKNDKYNLKVDRIIATVQFEDALKDLRNKHRKDILQELKKMIIDLGNYNVSKQKHNHNLKDLQGHKDLHIDGGKIVLVYKYISDNVLRITVDKETKEDILKLQDLVSHKELTR